MWLDPLINLCTLVHREIRKTHLSLNLLACLLQRPPRIVP